jgi:hypothetical protein
MQKLLNVISSRGEVTDTRKDCIQEKTTLKSPMGRSILFFLSQQRWLTHVNSKSPHYLPAPIKFIIQDTFHKKIKKGRKGKKMIKEQNLQS